LEKEYVKADEGAPFYIANANAENTEIYDLFSNGSNIIEIVDDDLRPGNKAFLVTPKSTDKKVWAYFIIPTRFKPGVTYKVDFEYRLIGDLEGNEATKVPFSVNFRYDDYNSDGTDDILIRSASGESFVYWKVQDGVVTDSYVRGIIAV
jgi:hypothetical protein